ncbi:MAG: hypothetical protein JNM24_20155 [Bdellovibrionaceae bacterium]|nr:hypothetical protein [Pseudobdellovibrionaceae bacterium]
MNKDVTKHKKNVNEKEKIKKALDAIESENKVARRRQVFCWRSRKQLFGYPKDLRNPTRH